MDDQVQEFKDLYCLHHALSITKYVILVIQQECSGLYLEESESGKQLRKFKSYIKFS